MAHRSKRQHVIPSQRNLSVTKPLGRRAIEQQKQKASGKTKPKAYKEEVLPDSDVEDAYDDIPDKTGQFSLDFLDDIFMDDIFPSEGKSKKKKKPPKRKAESSDEDDSEVEIVGDEVFERDSDLGEDEVADNNDDDDEDEFKGFEDENENDNNARAELKPILKKPNPYVPPVDATASTGKYIPPSLRKKQLESSNKQSEELVKLKRQCHGLINRLSEANVASIVSDFQQVFLNNSRQNVTASITAIILEMTAQKALILDGFVVVYGALIAALYKTIGTDFGAYFIQTLVENFDIYYKDSAEGKECINLMVLLSELYTFQVVGCSLIYDFIRLMLKEVNELNTELLLKLIQNSGSQLRHDDPAALKDIISMLNQAVAKIPSIDLNLRTKFLVETVNSWKNNRLKQNSTVTSESITRMRKFLGNIERTAEPLRVTLDDIHNVESKGKWWLVGAAWSGDRGRRQVPDLDVAAVKDILDTAEPDWLALAHQQRMNTDIRRAIFVAIMGSEDYADANDRLMKLQLKRVQEREIPRVLLHCCASEKNFNPFYAYVASLLCKQHSIKKTFQFSLWDLFKQLDGSLDEDAESEDDSEDEDIRFMNRGGDDDKTRARRAKNYANLYAILVSEGRMSLDILKNINFLTCTDELDEFLQIFFTALFKHTRVRSSRQKDRLAGEKALIQLVIKIKDNALLSKGLEFFLKRRLRTTKVSKSHGEKKNEIVKWGIDIICDSIERLSASDI
ncbi:hypothetical protein V1512DRAFT_257372 [Lipomyces arxii]|uniref:uncharacterized protein n=1 Tax=Lipomyces arxii TaxID=56418 RepID=UPI0034CF6CFF